MGPIFTYSENSKKSALIDYYFIFQIKQTLKEIINILFYQILAYTIHGKTFKKSWKNSKSKISRPLLNEKFELLDGLNYQIEDCFKYIIKKREKIGGYPLTKIYVNSVEHRMIFKISKQLSRAFNS